MSDDDDDYVEDFGPPIPIDFKITPCPEYHPSGDPVGSCARCGWGLESHDRA